MTDRDRHRLRGPVHTMRTTTAQWDPATSAWTPPPGHQGVTFRTDGNTSRAESRYGDTTSHTTYHYDAADRLIEIASWDEGDRPSRMLFRYDAGGRPEGTDIVDADGTRRLAETYAYDRDGRKTRVQYLAVAGLPDDVHDDAQAWQRFIPGAASSSPLSPLVTVLYDAGNRPSEILLHTVSHELQYRVTFTRDADGRLAMAETVLAGLDPQALMSVRCTYDGAGRLHEETCRVGTLMDAVTTHRYDARGALIETTSVTRVQDGGADTRGTRHERRTLFEYQYDPHGNWAERVTWGQPDDMPDAPPTTVERRTFTYHPV